eukprot:364100-Chlamydomonas_euryale.AAC.18
MGRHLLGARSVFGRRAVTLVSQLRCLAESAIVFRMPKHNHGCSTRLTTYLQVLSSAAVVYFLSMDEVSSVG